jgi:hypothetical protein
VLITTPRKFEVVPFLTSRDRNSVTIWCSFVPRAALRPPQSSAGKMIQSGEPHTGAQHRATLQVALQVYGSQALGNLQAVLARLAQDTQVATRRALCNSPLTSRNSPRSSRNSLRTLHNSSRTARKLASHFAQLVSLFARCPAATRTGPTSSSAGNLANCRKVHV